MDSNRKLRTGIIGATGYTGLELVRLLSRHPRTEVAVLTSESSAGQAYASLFPQFAGVVDLELVPRAAFVTDAVDVIFLALPHKASMEFIKGHDLAITPVIDLSADFRIKAVATYEEWYGLSHCCAERIAEAVYGLPELNREAIRTARLVANPGCYPTSAILPLSPLLTQGLIEQTGIVIDAKSGVTGAGYKPTAGTHYPTVNEGFKAYGIKGHRHAPEIEEVLSLLVGSPVQLQFTPHLLPVNRGILSTIYARSAAGTTEAKLQEALASAYHAEPFVRIVREPPALGQVRGSNFCDIYATHDEHTGNTLVVSVIDNLIKGAAGQAVQNMNIMFGMEETAGLEAIPLSP